MGRASCSGVLDAREDADAIESTLYQMERDGYTVKQMHTAFVLYCFDSVRGVPAYD